MNRISNPVHDLGDRLLDPEVMETPRRLSRDEHRAMAGPDWSWARPDPEEDDDND